MLTASVDRLPPPDRPEHATVDRCLAALHGALDWDAVAAVAAPWVHAVRRHPPPFWALERLLREYPIASAEGLALMRLAEALLRVPDAETAIALTADQLARADFESGSDSALARLSALALHLSQQFLPSPQEPDAQPGLLARLGARTVVGVALRAVQLLGQQFVLGQTIGQAQAVADAARRDQPGLGFSYDMLGEGARTAAHAAQYLRAYEEALQSIAAAAPAGLPPEGRDGISIKLSALHPRFEPAQRARVLAELVPRVWTLCERAAQADLPLTIDAEEAERLELTLDVFEALAVRTARQQAQWRGLGLALQAYQTRALELVDHVVALARRHRLRLMCRLVKGAYWDAEIKRAQELGLAAYPVFTHKQHTDASYLACARALLAAPDAVYPQFATHNAGTIAAILQLAAHPAGTAARFEMQRLHGMGEGLYREVRASHPGLALRVYAPVGQHRDLLAYLVRRLLENGANASFVHQLADAAVAVPHLLGSPLSRCDQARLPLPSALYGPERPNSVGLDLSVAAQRERLGVAWAGSRVPAVALSDAPAIAAALRASLDAFAAWSASPAAQRVAPLRTAADALQAELPRWSALLVREARKTWGDAIAEVREAIDLLRYYAHEAERVMAPITLPGPTGESNTLRLVARGAWVCISPWNFPLAIFMGQVAAALATGNTVLAKPAEQTPGVAWEAVRLLHASGVPVGALQLLHGPGETVGAALVADPRIAGVAFTGSTPVAKAIQRALAAQDGPIVPLIAETGGVNAMLVDSSALPEQVADAVLQSAYRSTGQRCSALRLLCLHAAIADPVLAMVVGAARELVLGDPADLATDLGPVIDAPAWQDLQQHLLRLQARARSHGLALAPPAAATAHLLGPQLFEWADIADARQEIFGPVLQVVRWSGDPLVVIQRINALGFGLTLGLQTRIDSRAEACARAARVGNVYVNRNMVGAVVGVQPFGGAGLSGTGPKAGGPHYLYRFCTEQTVTVNTTAAGGNASLLAAG